MGDDEILEELHEVRERLVADAGGDIAGLFRWLRDAERAEGRPTVTRSPKLPTPQCPETA